MEQIVYGKIRLQLLSAEIVRVEFSKNGKFCDENTFFIPDREQYAETQVAFTQEENAVFFGDYELYLPGDPKSLSGVRLEKNGKRVYTYKKLANSGELPPLEKTPEVFALSDTPRVVIPQGGYSAERTGDYVVEEHVQDVYLLLCKKNAKTLRRLYVELTGRCELVRLSTLGGWNSKYYAYNEEEAKQLILDYEAHGVPLDVMVIDTDWRASSDTGIGYDVDTKLFPDMGRFMDFAHAHGVEICFNDHPEPVNGAKNVFSPKEIAYREEKLQAIMSLGLDIWWYDRNWHTKLKSPSKHINPETAGLYLFEDITRHYYQKQAGDRKIYRRPVIMGNVDEIRHGKYLGINSSASHRYSVQWTGDIHSDGNALSAEIRNLIKGGNSCIPYVNADCGGHRDNPEKELFIRWMQFGVLSPVFRPHCTKRVIRTREPWVFDEETLNIVREYNQLRYRLLPVLYQNAYAAYETGEPIFKSLGWEYPKDKKAAAREDEYMLGNDILIAPVGGIDPVPVAAENYTLPVKATFFNGTELAGEPVAKTQWKTLEMDLNHVSPLNGVPVYHFSARFETEILFQEDKQLFIRCDDGATVRVDGEKVLEDKTLHSAKLFPLCRLSAGKPHKIEVEYFQADGEANCTLCCADDRTEYIREVYLPKGKWLDVFSGKTVTGGKTIKKECSLREMPLFVRAGALIPLAYEAKNTKEQKWNELVYDFYPCKESGDSGYLYEDDTETTAYQCGELRKSAYGARYDETENAFVITLHAAEGEFRGEKAFKTRNVVLKYHLLHGADKVRSITVNGEEAEAEWLKRDKKAFPFGEKTAPDGGVICLPVETDVKRDYEIRFYLA